MRYCPHCMQFVEEKEFCPACGKPMNYVPKEHQLPPGKILTVGKDNAYLLGASLGQGGFGVTYVALDKAKGQRVAVKEYFPIQCCQREKNGQVSAKTGMESVFQGGRKSFLEEAKMLSKHQDIPSVVKVMDYFETNGTAYLVMEFLNGVTLQQKTMREGTFRPETLMGKLPKLLEDMEKLHRSGIIHRDISPDNVMWMPDDTLKLLDFGCARSMEDGKSMTVQLKHGFAPVEQYMTRGQGPWTDVYALSATIYYCLTGKVPPMAPERLEADQIQPPSTLGVRMEQGQETALLWGLTVQPKARPVSMEVFKTRMFEQPGEYRQKERASAEKTAMENTVGAEYTEHKASGEASRGENRQGRPQNSASAAWKEGGNLSAEGMPFHERLSKKQGILIAAAAVVVLVFALAVIFTLR